MIDKFTLDTALLMIDVQQGVDVLEHWGGKRGRRNNPQAEANQLGLLRSWRRHGLPVFYTCHDSREQDSPLRSNLPSGAFKKDLEPHDGETVVRKDVNSGFVGTNLEIALRRRRISRLVLAGFFTNMCVETTARMAGNLGFDTYLVEDACATTNRIGPDGVDHDPELVHALSIASLHGEFCTVLSTRAALGLLDAAAPELSRCQGNE